jgi:hypothetical protein
MRPGSSGQHPREHLGAAPAQQQLRSRTDEVVHRERPARRVPCCQPVKQEPGIQRLISDRQQIVRKDHLRRCRAVPHSRYRARHCIAPRGHRQLTVEVPQATGAAHRHYRTGRAAGLELGDPGLVAASTDHHSRHHQYRAARRFVEGETGEGNRATAKKTDFIAGVELGAKRRPPVLSASKAVRSFGAYPGDLPPGHQPFTGTDPGQRPARGGQHVEQIGTAAWHQTRAHDQPVGQRGGGHITSVLGPAAGGVLRVDLPL